LEKEEISIKELAKDMGLGVYLLYIWCRKYGKKYGNNVIKEEDPTEVKKLM